MSSVEDRNSPTWRDENLLIVCAVEDYAHRHNMTTQKTLKLFRQYSVTDGIRQCYSTLHTQDIHEAVYWKAFGLIPGGPAAVPFYDALRFTGIKANAVLKISYPTTDFFILKKSDTAGHCPAVVHFAEDFIEARRK